MITRQCGEPADLKSDDCAGVWLCPQIPSDEFRFHYVRTTVRVHRYVDDTLALFHGPRKLATFDAKGATTKPKEVQRLAA